MVRSLNFSDGNHFLFISQTDLLVSLSVRELSRLMCLTDQLFSVVSPPAIGVNRAGDRREERVLRLRVGVRNLIKFWAECAGYFIMTIEMKTDDRIKI